MPHQGSFPAVNRASVCGSTLSAHVICIRHLPLTEEDKTGSIKSPASRNLEVRLQNQNSGHQLVRLDLNRWSGQPCCGPREPPPVLELTSQLCGALLPQDHLSTGDVTSQRSHYKVGYSSLSSSGGAPCGTGHAGHTASMLDPDSACFEPSLHLHPSRLSGS